MVVRFFCIDSNVSCMCIFATNLRIPFKEARHAKLCSLSSGFCDFDRDLEEVMLLRSFDFSVKKTCASLRKSLQLCWIFIPRHVRSVKRSMDNACVKPNLRFSWSSLWRVLRSYISINPSRNDRMTGKGLHPKLNHRGSRKVCSM